MTRQSSTPIIQPLDVPKAGSKFTHHIFRYPAKFHPPVVRALLDRYTEPGMTVLDPFVGSGTALVECAVMGRPSAGVDVDPVAIEVSYAKTRRHDLAIVRDTFDEIARRIARIERSPEEYTTLMHSDLSDEEYEKAIAQEALWVPEIPRLNHWFRRYVIIDLARMLAAINDIPMDQRTRSLARVSFASIIRNASNADPVPVSGLEYTIHMKRRDELGRLINPVALMRGSLKKCFDAVGRYLDALPPDIAEPNIILGDAMRLPADGSVSAEFVITSPPYHNAVDYYRRHQLEMFWLGHTANQEQRLGLLPKYIGRPHVAAKDPLLKEDWRPGELVGLWEEKMKIENSSRAADFRHYVTAMTKSFTELAGVLPSGGLAVFVVGHSRWKGQEIPTAEIFEEISAGYFTLQDRLFYPVVNRYMSYARHNEADINQEYVVVFKRNRS